MNANVQRVIYSNPCTIVWWDDNTKTMSRCDEMDEFDELTGFLMCVLKKNMKAKDMRKLLDDYVYGTDKTKIKRDEKKVYGEYNDKETMDIIKILEDALGLHTIYLNDLEEYDAF